MPVRVCVTNSREFFPIKGHCSRVTRFLLMRLFMLFAAGAAFVERERGPSAAASFYRGRIVLYASLSSKFARLDDATGFYEFYEKGLGIIFFFGAK